MTDGGSLAMDERDFEKLMIAARGKDLAEIRAAEVKRVLEELLTGEFAEVRETKFKVVLKAPSSGALAAISKVDDQVYLWVNPKNWERNPRFSEGALLAVLKHEILHCELGFLDDTDARFKEAARKRGIDLWEV